MPEHKPRIYLHENGKYVSIGFTDTNDTLLEMPNQVDGWRDWERAAKWIAAVEVILKKESSA